MSALIKRNKDGSAISPAKQTTPAVVGASSSPGPGRVSVARLFIGLGIALAADALDIAFPVVSAPVDFLTAILLCLVFGWRWEIFVVLVPEVVPATSMFPTWVLLVLYLAGVKRRK